MMTLKNKVAAEFFFQKAWKKKIEKKMQKASSRFIFFRVVSLCCCERSIREYVLMKR